MFEVKKILRIESFMLQYKMAIPNASFMDGYFAALCCIDENRTNSEIVGLVLTNQRSVSRKLVNEFCSDRFSVGK